MASNLKTLLIISVSYLISLVSFSLGLSYASLSTLPSPDAPSVFTQRTLSLCFRHDANHYLQVTVSGYDYDPHWRSNVAFFPAYPIICKIVSALGITPVWATLIVSNIFLAVAFVLLDRYIRARQHDVSLWQRLTVLSLFGCSPLGVFFRLPYSESLFVACSIAVLLGMFRQWPLVLLAVLAGLSSSVRPVGAALTLAVLLHVWQRSGGWRRRSITVIVLAPVACWGLLAYMAYLWATFGDPLAFAKTQQYWVLNVPADRSFSAKAWSLVTLEPVWGIFVPGSQRHWGNWGPNPASTGLTCWNPVLFVLAAVLVVIGRRRGWLTDPECVAGVGLLVIPYLTRAYEMSMASHGRFAAVVVAQYLVAARLLSHRPKLSVAIVSASACLQAIFTALYARNYWVF